mgnify:CR=1 FL=1
MRASSPRCRSSTTARWLAARATAEQLLALNAEAATLIEADGTMRDVPPRQLLAGQRILVVHSTVARWLSKHDTQGAS